MFPLLALELGVNMKMDISYFNYANINEYQTYVENIDYLIQNIYEKDTEKLYRIENDVRYDQICFNDAMLIGYPSITHYSSVMPYTVSSFAAKEGFSCTPGGLSILYKRDEADSKTAGKSSIKYLITKEPPENMQGWILQKEEPYYVLRNKNYQPVIRFESDGVGTATIMSAERACINMELNNTADDSQRLLLMIPEHRGWKLKLDGQVIIPEQYQDAMMELMIPEGQHTLTMEFQPVLWKAGIAVSTVAGLIVTVLCFGIAFYKKRCLIQKK